MFTKHAHGLCCKDNAQELFDSGVGWSNSSAACRELCAQREHCAFASHAQGRHYASCRLCSGCDALRSHLPYVSWRKSELIHHDPLLLHAYSLGAFSSETQQAEQRSLLRSLANARLLLVGDSTVRYQWMHLVRTALEVPRDTPLADHPRLQSLLKLSPGRGKMPGANQSDRGGSGDHFWNQPLWMVVTTLNITLAYVRQTSYDFRWLQGGPAALARCDLMPVDRMKEGVWHSRKILNDDLLVIQND